MLINSSYFGRVDIREDKILTFDPPIPGFSTSNKYFIITEDAGENAATDDGEDRLFCWLHSVDDEDIAFALLDVFKVKDDYQPEIEEEYLEQLKYDDGDNIAVYNIVNIPEKINDITVNLLAPLVINFTKLRGMQVILGNGDYSLRHKIFDDLQRASEKKMKEEVN